MEGLPEHASYQAEIDVRDALALDNRRFATAPASRNLRILAVTPRPQALASLRSIPGVQVDIVAPADYQKSERTGYGLEIFHFAAPEVLPENPALFILPPEKSFLVELGAPLGNVQISNWREPNTLTRYINFSLFRPTYARPLKPQTTGDIVIESPAGALAFALERKGFRYLVSVSIHFLIWAEKICRCRFSRLICSIGFSKAAAKEPSHRRADLSRQRSSRAIPLSRRAKRRRKSSGEYISAARSPRASIRVRVTAKSTGTLVI